MGVHVSYSLNSLKAGYVGDYLGFGFRVLDFRV